MKKFWIIFCLALCIPTAFIQASGKGYGLYVQPMTSKALQAAPDEVLTLSFLIQNYSSKSDTFVTRMDLPKGWQTIPMDLPPVNLGSQGETIEIIAVKLPKDARVGRHVVKLTVQGTDNETLIGVAEVNIEVLAVDSLNSQLTVTTKHVVEGTGYKATLALTNNGNFKRDVTLAAQGVLLEKVNFEPSNRVEVDPGRTVKVNINVKTKSEKRNHSYDFLTIFIKDSNSLKQLESKSISIPLHARSTFIKGLEKYQLIPSVSTFVAGFNNWKKTLFINTEGGGYVDREKTKWFSYLFRIPFIRQTSVFQQFGGTPEKYFVNYTSAHIDAYGADGVYHLSPLTLTSRYGRGGMLTLKSPNFQVGSLAVARSSAVPRTDVGAFFRFMPIKELGFQTTYYYANGKLSNSNYTQENDVNILSVSGNASYKEWTNIQGEWGVSYSRAPRARKDGYYLQGNGRPVKWFWYNFQKVYAPYLFLGYYNNYSENSYSAGFRIKERLNLFGAFTSYDSNLDNNPLFSSANKSQRVLGEATLTLPMGLFISTAYNNFEARNHFFGLGFKTNFASLRITQSLRRFTFVGNAEVGKYIQEPIDSFTKTWQRYSAYNYLRVKGQTLSVYGRWGYLYKIHNIRWNQTYGASATANIGRFKSSFVYEHSQISYAVFRNFYQGNFSYRFRNNQILEFKGSIIRPFRAKATYRGVLSFKIPWGLPIGKKADRTQVKGKTYYEENGILRPTANPIISCNELDCKAGKKGDYSFDYLKPGTYLLDVDDTPEGFITKEAMPQRVEVAKNKVTNLDVVFIRPCSVEGNLSYYNYDKANANKYLKSHSAIAQITLVSASGEKYSIEPNKKGNFHFPNLRPGQWNISIDVDNLSYDYEIEQPRIDFEVVQGENKYFKLRILQLKRQLDYI
ncbi:MAG: hypothetical protein S4CHLAM6_03280 [Chlamydiae bacterium]|nr:hypothetical protein [Chlamydiota bacterium]